MKIVFVVPDMAGGGTEKVISLLANEYVEKGISVDILLFAGNQVAYKLDERIKVVFAGEESRGNMTVRAKRLLAMRRYFKVNKGCYIFSFSTYGTGFIVMSTIGMQRRMLVSERTDPRSCNHKPYRNFFYRLADCLVFQTEDARNCFPESMRRKSFVLPNPVDPALPEPYQGERTKRIVSVGRLAPVKNHRMLIQAFHEFNRRYGEYSLHLYGQGDLEKELREQAKKAGLEEKVIFHGFCTEVKEEIRDSSMFVLSSDYEGISNAMVEALSMGIPVIATDCPIGGCRMYIRNEENGLLIPAGDTQALVKAMEKIAADGEFARRLSNRGTDTRTNCSAEKIAEELLHIARSSFDRR